MRPALLLQGDKICGIVGICPRWTSSRICTDHRFRRQHCCPPAPPTLTASTTCCATWAGSTDAARAITPCGQHAALEYPTRRALPHGRDSISRRGAGTISRARLARPTSRWGFSGPCGGPLPGGGPGTSSAGLHPGWRRRYVWFVRQDSGGSGPSGVGRQQDPRSCSGLGPGAACGPGRQPGGGGHTARRPRLGDAGPPDRS